MLKINTTSIIKDLPIWEVEYMNLPDDYFIKGLKYQEIDIKRQFYIWGDEIGDKIINNLQLENIKDELINHDVVNLEYPSWLMNQSFFALLPQVLAPGTVVRKIETAIAQKFNLNPDVGSPRIKTSKNLNKDLNNVGK
jgi:hypothetical protein